MGCCASKKSKPKSRDIPILTGTNAGTVRIKNRKPPKDNELDNIDPKTVPTVPHQGKIISAKVTDVYDGDTITVVFRFGDDFMKIRIRIVGVDAPEVKVRGQGRGKMVLLEEEAGRYIREKVKKMIDQKTIQVRFDKWDKYGGRVIGSVILPPPSKHTTLTEWLMSKKYAKEYFGKKKEDWTEAELRYILQH